MVDPGQRRMKALGLVTDDSSPPDPASIPNELKKMRIARPVGDRFQMPEKFGGTRTWPTIWIIDPTSKVRIQFDTGASDHAIYGALVDLRKGGSGNARPRKLPGERGSSMGETGLFTAGFGLVGILLFVTRLFAWFYHPMAFLMTVVFTNGWLPFNYAAGIGAIARTGADYVKTVIVLVVAVFAGYTLDFILNDVALVAFPDFVRAIAAGVVYWWVMLYSLLVEGYSIGRFYLRNKAALGWF
jgi:hypothetical protein